MPPTEILAHHTIDRVSLEATITRADGRVEHLGEIAATHYRHGRPLLGWRGWLTRKLAMGGLLMLGATLIVNGGQAIATNRMTGAGTEPKFVAWGTGAGTAGVTDTTLFTESADEARTSGTSSRVTTTVTNDTYQVVGLITVATAAKTITNVGLFDASTVGNLYFKSDFAGLPLNIGDAITWTIKVKFS